MRGFTHSEAKEGEINVGLTGIPISVEKQEGNKGGVTPESIIREVERRFDTKLHTGRVGPKSVKGTHHRRTGDVRIQEFNSTDLPIIAHEIGHKIDNIPTDKEGRIYRGDVRQSQKLTGLHVPADATAELKELDYSDTRKAAGKAWVSEGIAEFLRLYMSDGAEMMVKAPKYHEWFTENWKKNNPKLAEDIDAIRDMVTTLKGMGVMESEIQRINPLPLKEQLREAKADAPDWIAEKWKNFKQSFYDDATIPEWIDAIAIKAGYQTDSEEVMFSKLFRHYRNSENLQSERAFLNGVHTSSGKGVVLTDSMPEVLRKIESEQEYYEWRTFAHAVATLEERDLADPRSQTHREVAERLRNLEFSGKFTHRPSETGMDPAKAKEIIKKIKGDTEKYERFTETSRAFTAYANGMLEMLARDGVIPKQLADFLIAYRPNYFPLERQLTTGGKRKQGKSGYSIVQQGDAIQRRFGSGAAIVDPMEALSKRLVRYYRMAQNKQVLNQLIRQFDPEIYINKEGELSVNPGEGFERNKNAVQNMAKYIVRVAPNLKKVSVPAAEAAEKLLGPLVEEGGELSDELQEILNDFTGNLDFYRPDYRNDPGKNIFTYYDKNGTAQQYQVDKELYDILMATPNIQKNLLVKFLTVIAKGIRIGATGLNANFWVKNMLFFDYVSNMMNSKHQTFAESVYAPWMWTAKYLASERRAAAGGMEDLIVSTWKAHGGPIGGTYFGLDRHVLNDPTKRLIKQTIKKGGWGTAFNLQTFRDIVSFSDVGPRLSEFSGAMRNAGYITKIVPDGQFKGQQQWYNTNTNQFELPGRAAIVEAVAAAHDVTVDFNRMGSAIRHLNPIMMFLNVGIQGPVKSIRTLRDAVKGDKQAQKRVPFVLASMLSMTALYWYFRDDDDDYNDMADWEWLGNWTLPYGDGEDHFRFPKPREWRIVINGFELMLRNMDGEDKLDFKRWMREEFQNLIPGSGVAGFSTMLNVASDTDTFGRPIEGDVLKRLPKSERYDAQTGRIGHAASSINKALHSIPVVGESIPYGSPKQWDYILNEFSGGLVKSYYTSLEKFASGEGTLHDFPGMKGVTLDYHDSQAVKDFKAKAKDLEEQQAVRDRRGDKSEDYETYKFEKYKELVNGIRRLGYETADHSERDKIMSYASGLARKAMGRKGLISYPTPFSQFEAAPDSIKSLVTDPKDGWLPRKLMSATDPRPERKKGETKAEFDERVERWNTSTGYAKKLLDELEVGNLGEAELTRILGNKTKQAGGNTKLTISGKSGSRKPSAYGKRVRVLSGLDL